MSYKQFSTSEFDHAPVRVRGGKVHYSISVMDPMGVYHVECEKHPGKQMRIVWSMLDADGLANAAALTLGECEGCAHELEHRLTRFPEGAEL